MRRLIATLMRTDTTMGTTTVAALVRRAAQGRDAHLFRPTSVGTTSPVRLTCGSRRPRPIDSSRALLRFVPTEFVGEVLVGGDVGSSLMPARRVGSPRWTQSFDDCSTS